MTWCRFACPRPDPNRGANLSQRIPFNDVEAEDVAGVDLQYTGVAIAADGDAGQEVGILVKGTGRVVHRGATGSIEGHVVAGCRDRGGVPVGGVHVVPSAVASVPCVGGLGYDMGGNQAEGGSGQPDQRPPENRREFRTCLGKA